MHELHEISTFLLIIFAVGLVISLVATKLRTPEPIIGVIVGLCLALMHLSFLEEAVSFITQGVVVQGLVLMLFLPALLGKETSHMTVEHLKENRKPIALLAIGGSLLTFLIIGLGMHYVAGYSLVFAFTYASVMCATDPITVASIFKTANLHKRVATIIEGESLFNDGVAVVLFRIASVSFLVYVEKGMHGFAEGLIDMAVVIVGGVLIGGLCGFLASVLTKQYNDVEIETRLSIVLFFGSYLLAESIHVSGVIAVVVAGLTLWNYGRKHGMQPETRVGIERFWSIIANIANSIIFLLVGLELTTMDFQGKWLGILFGILIVLIARSLSVYMSLFPVRGMPVAWKHMINWGGLKGSLSIVLALSLPHSFSMREELVVLTFSTVLFSILVQGLTVGPLIKRLGLHVEQKAIVEYEEVNARYQMTQVALCEIERQYKARLISEDLYREQKSTFTSQAETHKKEITHLYDQYPAIKREQQEELERGILYTQFDKLSELERDDRLSQDAAAGIQHDIVKRIEELNEQRDH